MSGEVTPDALRRIRGYIARLGSSDEIEATEAESRLLRLGRKAVRPLLELVVHESPVVRSRAAYLLGRAGDSVALPALQYLLEDADATVRHGAVLALGELGDPRAVSDLVGEATCHGRSPTLVRAAYAALGKMATIVLVWTWAPGYESPEARASVADGGDWLLTPDHPAQGETRFADFDLAIVSHVGPDGGAYCLERRRKMRVFFVPKGAADVAQAIRRIAVLHGFEARFV